MLAKVITGQRRQEAIETGKAALVGFAVGALVASVAPPIEYAYAQIRGRSIAEGRVECLGLVAVTGIWIETINGSGWAKFKQESVSPEVASYNRELPQAESYTIHVGCGGSPNSWQLANYSHYPVESGDEAYFVCGRFNGADPADIVVGHGTCQEDS